MTTPRPLARRIIRRALGYLPPGPRRRVMYARAYRRWLRLGNPVLFTEKMNWCIAYDRRAIIGATADKLAMKDQAVRSGVPAPLTLWSGTSARSLATMLKETSNHDEWIAKPNHSSGDYIFGSGVPAVKKLQPLFDHWLATDRAKGTGEWSYSCARALIVVESRIGEAHRPPTDYKFFVFAGDVAMCKVSREPVRKTEGVAYVSPSGEALPFRDPKTPALDWEGVAACFPRMVEMAARLGQDFDFIRVDFFEQDGEFYFSELTPYHAGGLKPIAPELDALLGSKWSLPSRSEVVARDR